MVAQAVQPDAADTLTRMTPWVRHLARAVAMRFMDQNIDRSDLVQEGLLALWRILPGYDPAKGCMQTFAWKRVSGAMIDFARKVHSLPAQPLVDEPVCEDERLHAIDDGARAEFRSLANRFKIDFDDRDIDVMVMRFRDGLTMKQVGQRLWVDVSRISQLERRIIEEFRTRLTALGRDWRTAFN